MLIAIMVASLGLFLVLIGFFMALVTAAHFDEWVDDNESGKVG